MARRKPEDFWLQWSYSKLRTLFNCPYQFFHQYVLRTPKPKAPILAVGSALHFLAHRYNKVNYKSADSFAAAWRGFWAGVLKGDHGSGSFRSAPEEIAWQSEGEAGYWFHRGSEILTGYYQRRKEMDEEFGPKVKIGRLSERRLRFHWRGLTMVGVIDRVDEYPDYVRIIDLKMGKEEPVVAISSFQPVFYQVGYELCLRRKIFNGKPLLGFATENLFSGAEMPVPPAEAQKLLLFSDYLHEAAAYVQAILTRDTSNLPKLIHFHPRDIGKSQFYPRLPRGQHCRYCSYMEECAESEKNSEYQSLELWVGRLAESMCSPAARQQSLF